MTFIRPLFLFVVLLCQISYAQQIPIDLHEVIVPDRQLVKHSTSKSILHLNDSIIGSNGTSLSTLLNYNFPIYFKESGNGMVSSPSFRGTTAQQTAVIWNGININSQFNGQTDFNAVSTAGYSDISVRAGGGSAIYGSSAIGGTIHLNNNINFGSKLQHQIRLEYGSFNTALMQYHIAASTDKVSVNAGFSRNSSDNDFDYVDGTGRNDNGQYYNNNFSAAVGYRFRNSSMLRYYSNFYEGNRHFSLLSPTDNRTRYEDFNVRNLLEYVTSKGNFSSNAKLAYIIEDYKYFEDIDNEVHDGGVAESVVAKYDASYAFGKNKTLNGIIEYAATTGRGTDIISSKREVAAIVMLWKHRTSQKFLYEISTRLEETNSYKSPLLFAMGMKYDRSTHYSFRANASHNFRIPTFNDLYWSEGGNTELLPERSYQAEIGNDIVFKNIKVTANIYYISIRDMIQWLPGTTTVWLPRNVQKVNSYGGEILLKADKKFNSHLFSLNATYAYTVSENEQTRKQLIYVPFHKVTASMSYSRNNVSVILQNLYSGDVFTRSDNNPRYNVNAFFVSNLCADYTYGDKTPLKIGVKVLNLFNEEYQLMIRREAPGRSFNIYLNLNI